MAIGARDKPHTTAAVADERRVLSGDPFEHFPQLPSLVHLPDLFRPAEPPTSNEHLGQNERPALHQQLLKLAAEGCIHGNIALVDGHVEASEDGADSAAVLEGASDAAERGEVENHLGALRLVGKSPREGPRRGAPMGVVRERSEDGERLPEHGSAGRGRRRRRGGFRHRLQPIRIVSHEFNDLPDVDRRVIDRL